MGPPAYEVLKMHLERETELCDVTFSSASSSPSVDMEDEDGTCLLDVLCDPQALNNFLHGTNELQNDDLLITCSSGEPSSLFTGTPSPMSLLADDITTSQDTPPAECVDLSFLEEALLGGSPEGGGERRGEGQEEQEEEEVPPCDILQQSLQEADITEHTMALEAGLVQPGPGEGHTLSLCPPLLPPPPPAAVPFLSKTIAFPHPHPGPPTLPHRDTQAAVEPPQPSLLAVGPGCPSLKPAAPHLVGLLPGNIFPAPPPETSFSLTPTQASNTSFSLIQKAVPSLTGRPLLAPTLRAAAAPGIFLQRGPLPIQPKLPINIQPRLVQISPKPPGPGGPGQKPSPGLTFLPGTPSSNILLSPPPPQPKPAQHLTGPHLTKPQPVSLQLVNQGGGSFLIQPQGLFHGQNQFLLPAQSPVTLSQLPAQSPVTLSQLPGQSSVNLSQLPGQSPVTLSQLPGQSPVTLSQLPGQSPVTLSQPGGSARPLFTSGHHGATVQSVQGMTPSIGHHLVDGSQILTAVPHHRQLNFSPHTVFSTTSTGQLSLRQGTLLSGPLQLQSGTPTVFQMPAQLAGAYNPQGPQGQGGPGQHATLLHSPALGSHITLMHSGMQLTSTHPDSHMTSISILNTTPPAVVQGLPFTPQTSRPLGGVTEGQISVQQASVVLLPDRAGHEERREEATSPHLPQSTRHLFQQHASLQPSTASLQSTSPPVMALLQTPLEAPQALVPPGMLPKYLLDQVGTLHKHLLDPVGTLHKHLLDPVGTLHKHLPDPVGTLPKHLLDPVGTLHKHLLDPVGSLPKHLLDPVGSLPKHMLDQTETGTKPGVEEDHSPTQAFIHLLQQQALTPPNPSPSPEVLAGTVSVEDHTVSAVASEMEEAPPPIQPAVLGQAGAQSAMPLSPCVLVAYPAPLHPETEETTLPGHSPTLLCQSPPDQGLGTTPPAGQGLVSTPPNGQGLVSTPPNGQGLVSTPLTRQGLGSTPQQDSLSSPPSGATSVGLAGSGSGSAVPQTQTAVFRSPSPQLQTAVFSNPSSSPRPVCVPQQQPDPLLVQPDPLLVQPDPLCVTPSSYGEVDQANQHHAVQQHTKQSKPPAALAMDVEGKAFTLDVHPPSPRPQGHQWPPGPHIVQGPNTVRWPHTVQEPQYDQGPQAHREQDQWLRAVQTAQQSKTKVAGPVAKEREQRLTEAMCRLQQQLFQDQGPVQSPYICSPFSSLGEAVTHLLPYHTCAGHLPSQDDFNLVDKQFDTVSGFLLKRTKDMLNKYRQLLLGEALQVMPSAEMVMLDRLFLQSERFSLGEDRHRARRDPESFLMALHASESSSSGSSCVGLGRSGSPPSPPAWTRLSDRPPGLRTYHSTSRGGLRLTIKHKAGSRMVVHNSACDTMHSTAPSGHKRHYAGQLINGSGDLTEQGSSHRTSCPPIDEEMSNGALPSKAVEDIPHGHHSDSRESVAQIQTTALGSHYGELTNSLTMPSLDPQTACLEPPPPDPGEMSTPKLKRFRPTLPDLPSQADRHSYRPQPFPQTSYRPQPFPQTSYRPQPFPQTSYRPQPLPQTSYRPQPLPQTSDRPQPLSQTSDRPQPLSQTSYRPEASPSPQLPLPEDNTLSEHLQSAIDSILELQRLQGPTAAAQPRIQGACPAAGPASLLDQAITSILQGNL